jgi:chromosome segregation ATPase
MAQATNTELRELRDLIVGIREEMRSDSNSIREEMRVGFANIDTRFANVDRKIEVGFANVDTQFANVDTQFANVDTKLTEIKGDIGKIDTRLTIVETSITKLDNRLWAFIGLVVTSTLGTLFAVFVRYIFWDAKM